MADPLDDDDARAVRHDAVRHDAVRHDAVRLDAGRLGELAADLVGDALVRNADNPALDDPRYLDWIADELAHAARRADRRVPDAVFLAHGRALRASVEARRLGVRCRVGAPPVQAAGRHGTPGDVLGAALAVAAAPLVDLAVAAGAGRDLWDEPCEQWVALPTGLSADRYLALRVRGDSMVPLMHSGDTVLVRLESAVQPGSVVVARHPDDGYVCKRVRRVDGAVIELDSLAVDGPAFTLPRDERLVLGTVVMVWQAVVRRV